MDALQRARAEQSFKAHAADPEPFACLLGWSDAWTLCSLVQLALRHPALQGRPISDRARRLLAQMYASLCAGDPDLQALSAAGYDPHHDEPLAQPVTETPVEHPPGSNGSPGD